LRAFDDHLILFESASVGTGIPHTTREDTRRMLEPLLGRKRPDASPVLITNMAGDSEELALALRGLEPHQAGGGTAALVASLIAAPASACPMHDSVRTSLDAGAGNNVSAVREMYARLLRRDVGSMRIAGALESMPEWPFYNPPLLIVTIR
jgi:hypothetical protein